MCYFQDDDLYAEVEYMVHHTLAVVHTSSLSSNKKIRHTMLQQIYPKNCEESHYKQCKVVCKCVNHQHGLGHFTACSSPNVEYFDTEILL